MPIATIGRRLLQKDDRLSWRAHMVMIRDVRSWERSIRRQYPVLDHVKGEVTAYVANFRRPQNIKPIVRSLLACDAIGRIIVSDNNPALPLGNGLKRMSGRITVLSHAEPQNCYMRYVHLQPFPSRRYLILDDDIFLDPPQIDALITHLEKDPSVPHGIFGQQWTGECLIDGVQRREESIDVINRVYAFTDKHLEQVLKSSDSIAPIQGYEKWGLSLFDDMLLSFSGSGRPRIHDVGPIVNCPSQGRKGTANWRMDGFKSGREEAFQMLKMAMPLVRS